MKSGIEVDGHTVSEARLTGRYLSAIMTYARNLPRGCAVISRHRLRAPISRIDPS